jgi:hypothetical protein
MDHLLVDGFDIGRETAPSAALRGRARRSNEKINSVRIARNGSGIPQRSLRAPLAHA